MSSGVILIVAAQQPSPRIFKSDIYIFARQNETDPRKWNAFDLQPWAFYVLRQADLRSLVTGRKSSLVKLETIASPLNAADLRTKSLELIRQVEVDLLAAWQAAGSGSTQTL